VKEEWDFLEWAERNNRSYAKRLREIVEAIEVGERSQDMCRRVCVDVTWDSEHEEEDVGDMFVLPEAEKLQPGFMEKLLTLFEDYSMGGIKVSIQEIPREESK
jgi:hypothetical protein